MGKFRPLARGVVACLILGGLVAGCSDDPEITRDEEATPRSTTTERDGAGTEPQASTSVTTTTSPYGDTIDLADAPPVVFSNPQAVVYFADLMDEPEYRAGPVTQGQTLLISPDATLVAVATPGDAVRPSRVELISVESGRAVESFDIDLDRTLIGAWSPDSSAVVSQGPDGWVVQRIDGSTQDVATPMSQVVFGSDGSTVSAVDCATCTSYQVRGSGGVPVAVSSDAAAGTIVAGIYDVGAKRVDPLDGEWGMVRLQALQCERFTVVSGYVDGGPKSAILDVVDRKLLPVEPVKNNRICPVANTDGTKVAVPLSAGGTVVVDVATGASTVVARQGVPLAWTKDGTRLAVQGNGTFIVGSDGSGGKEASVVLKRFCQIGETGTLLAEVTGSTPESSGLAVYDIAADSASLVDGNLAIGSWCDLSSDGKWMVTGEMIVSLEDGAATVLRRKGPDGFGIGGELRFPDPRWRSERVVAGA